MLRLASTSTTRFPLAFTPISLRSVAAFHSSRYSLLEAEPSSRSSSSSSNDSPPVPNLTPAVRRRLATPPEFSSSSSTTTLEPGPNPISAPPDQVVALPKKRTITSVNELPASFGRNQIIQVPQEVEDDLQDVLSAFKKSPVRFAFAYGSGVFRQKGYTTEVSPIRSFLLL